MTQQKIDYQKITTGYEFEPAEIRLTSDAVTAYLDATEGDKSIYEQYGIAPPMAISALAMTAMASGLSLPPGAIHVSQDLQFRGTVSIDETLTSQASVIRKVERGKFHMLTIGIKIVNNKQTTVLTGETGFILPFS